MVISTRYQCVFSMRHNDQHYMEGILLFIWSGCYGHLWQWSFIGFIWKLSPYFTSRVFASVRSCTVLWGLVSLLELVKVQNIVKPIRYSTIWPALDSILFLGCTGSNNINNFSKYNEVQGTHHAYGNTAWLFEKVITGQ